MIESTDRVSPTTTPQDVSALTDAQLNVLAARDNLRSIHDAEAGLLSLPQRMAAGGYINVYSAPSAQL